MFSPSTEMGLTDIEMAQFEYEEGYFDDRQYDFEYEVRTSWLVKYKLKYQTQTFRSDGNGRWGSKYAECFVLLNCISIKYHTDINFQIHIKYFRSALIQVNACLKKTKKYQLKWSP